MSVLDVSPNALIGRVADELKKKPEIQPPAWVLSVKSGSYRERVPQQDDFWFQRCASLLRTLYVQGNVGVQRLRRKYGGRTTHIVRRSHHRPAGGKIIRLALQQLEKAGFVAKDEKKKGRILTSAGRSLLEKASGGSEKLKQ